MTRLESGLSIQPEYKLELVVVSLFSSFAVRFSPLRRFLVRRPVGLNPVS